MVPSSLSAIFTFCNIHKQELSYLTLSLQIYSHLNLSYSHEMKSFSIVVASLLGVAIAAPTTAPIEVAELETRANNTKRYGGYVEYIIKNQGDATADYNRQHAFIGALEVKPGGSKYSPPCYLVNHSSCPMNRSHFDKISLSIKWLDCWRRSRPHIPKHPQAWC